MALLYLYGEFKCPEVAAVVMKSSSNDALKGQNGSTDVVQAKEIFVERAAIEAIMGTLPEETWKRFGTGARGASIRIHKKFIRAKGMGVVT